MIINFTINKFIFAFAFFILKIVSLLTISLNNFKNMFQSLNQIDNSNLKQMSNIYLMKFVFDDLNNYMFNNKWYNKNINKSWQKNNDDNYRKINCIIKMILLITNLKFRKFILKSLNDFILHCSKTSLNRKTSKNL